MGRGRRNFGGFNPGWRSSDELTPGYFLAALSGRFPRGHPLVLGQSRGWAWRSEVERNELSNLCSVTADRQDQTTSLRRVRTEPCRYLARNEPQANAAQVSARGSVPDGPSPWEVNGAAHNLTALPRPSPSRLAGRRGRNYAIVVTPGGVGLTADLPGATIWSPLRGCAGRKVRAGLAFPVGGQQTAATVSFYAAQRGKAWRT